MNDKPKIKTVISGIPKLVDRALSKSAIMRKLQQLPTNEYVDLLKENPEILRIKVDKEDSIKDVLNDCLSSTMLDLLYTN